MKTHALPLAGVAHDDRAALGIVGGNTDLGDVLRALDAQLVVNLKLDRQTVAGRKILQMCEMRK